MAIKSFMIITASFILQITFILCYVNNYPVYILFTIRLIFSVDYFLAFNFEFIQLAIHFQDQPRVDLTPVNITH